MFTLHINIFSVGMLVINILGQHTIKTAPLLAVTHYYIMARQRRGDKTDRLGFVRQLEEITGVE